MGIGRTREGKFESESQVHMTYEGEQGSCLFHWSTFCGSCRHFLFCTECVNYQCVNYQFFKMFILVQIKSPVFLTFAYVMVLFQMISVCHVSLRLVSIGCIPMYYSLTWCDILSEGPRTNNGVITQCTGCIYNNNHICNVCNQ